MKIREVMEKLQEISRESERVSSILKAKDMMLSAALAGRDPVEIEKAREELVAAFEANVDFKIKATRQGEELQRKQLEADDD